MKTKHTDKGQNVATDYSPIKRRDSLRRRMLVWFLLVALVPLTIVSFISFYAADQSLRKAAFKSLSSNVEAKVAFIENWFDYRLLDLESQATNTNNSRFLKELTAAFNISDLGRSFNIIPRALLLRMHGRLSSWMILPCSCIGWNQTCQKSAVA